MVKYCFKKKDKFIAYESRPGKEYENDPASALLSYLTRKGGINEKTKSVTITKKTYSYTNSDIPMDMVKEMDTLRQQFKHILRLKWKRLCDDKPINCLEWRFFIQTKFTTYHSSEDLDLIRKAFDQHEKISIITAPGSFTLYIATKDVTSLAKVKLLLGGDHQITDIRKLKDLSALINKM